MTDLKCVASFSFIYKIKHRKQETLEYNFHNNNLKELELVIENLQQEKGISPKEIKIMFLN